MQASPPFLPSAAAGEIEGVLCHYATVRTRTMAEDEFLTDSITGRQGKRTEAEQHLRVLEADGQRLALAGLDNRPGSPRRCGQGPRSGSLGGRVRVIAPSFLVRRESVEYSCMSRDRMHLNRGPAGVLSCPSDRDSNALGGAVYLLLVHQAGLEAAGPEHPTPRSAAVAQEQCAQACRPCFLGHKSPQIRSRE
jgi:hypothetical protein